MIPHSLISGFGLVRGLTACIVLVLMTVIGGISTVAAQNQASLFIGYTPVPDKLKAGICSGPGSSGVNPTADRYAPDVSQVSDKDADHTAAFSQTKEAIAYVVNWSSDNVSVIDVASEENVATISVDNSPTDVAFTPDGRKAYITHSTDGDVSVIDVDSGEIIDRMLAVGDEHIAVAPTGNIAYVVDAVDDQVEEIDLASGEIVDSIPVWGGHPNDVAFAPDASTAYVTHEAGYVSVIDVSSGKAIETIKVGRQTQEVAFAPDGSRAYVANAASHNISVIDVASASVIETISMKFGSAPRGIAITPNGTKAYITNTVGGYVSVIDLAEGQVTSRISMGERGRGPESVAITPDGRKVYVTASNVSVIDVTTGNVTTIPVGESPEGIAITSLSGSDEYTNSSEPGGGAEAIIHVGSMLPMSSVEGAQVQVVTVDGDALGPKTTGEEGSVRFLVPPDRVLAVQTVHEDFAPQVSSPMLQTGDPGTDGQDADIRVNLVPLGAADGQGETTGETESSWEDIAERVVNVAMKLGDVKTAAELATEAAGTTKLLSLPGLLEYEFVLRDGVPWMAIKGEFVRKANEVLMGGCRRTEDGGVMCPAEGYAAK